MKILTWPSKELLRISKPVNDLEEISEYLDDMFLIMREKSGLGLAAPQVGVHKRFFIIDELTISKHDKRDTDVTISVIVNPEIIDGFGELFVQEGCLSAPGETFDVLRASFISVRFQDLDGNDREETFSGLTAIVFQHEIDHLDGIVLAEKQPLDQRREIMERVEKYET